MGSGVEQCMGSGVCLSVYVRRSCACNWFVCKRFVKVSCVSSVCL